MIHPEITDDQRDMVVTMMANAIRKDSHLRARANRANDTDNPVTSVMAERRSESSQRYVEGMRDLLRVMFANGNTLAEECLEEAYARASGASFTSFTDNGNGNGKAFH